MKIFDCFMYFDEDVVLDVRLNTLNAYVDNFIIVESLFSHKGEKRALKFDIKKFSKFKNKITYLVYDKEPDEIRDINEFKNAETAKPDNIKVVLDELEANLEIKKTKNAADNPPIKENIGSINIEYDAKPRDITLSLIHI